MAAAHGFIFEDLEKEKESTMTQQLRKSEPFSRYS